MLVGGVVKGTVDFGHHADAPASIAEMIAKYQTSHKAMVEKVKKMTDQEFNRSLKFPIGPNKLGDFRGGDILRMFLMDQVHHRGQFSVYLRMAGAECRQSTAPALTNRGCRSSRAVDGTGSPCTGLLCVSRTSRSDCIDYLIAPSYLKPSLTLPRTLPS